MGWVWVRQILQACCRGCASHFFEFILYRAKAHHTLFMNCALCEGKKQGLWKASSRLLIPCLGSVPALRAFFSSRARRPGRDSLSACAMAASARRAFRLPVLALGVSLVAWAGLTFSAVAPNGRDVEDIEICFGKYRGWMVSDLVKQDPGYCQWMLKQFAIDPDDVKPDFAEVAQWILENAPEVADGEPVVNFGKYRGQGKRLSEIVKEDPDYCRWILETAKANRQEGQVGGPLAEAADWIQKNCPDFLANAPVEDTVMFGKHKGETFQQVLEEDEEYLCWLLGLPQDETSPNARRLIEFAKEHAVC